MRHIKQLLVLFLVFNVFASCEKEEVSYALQDISAPTDVKAIFDISQDEIGLVTLTPAATGASEFQVYFGDVEDETPTMVNPGETINYTYAEGEYSLRIIAVGLTGLTSELVRIVTVSFDAPEDLDVKIAISGTNPFEVLVTPSATNAAVFDVYFGDAEDEEPTTIIAGETANHEYAEIGEYTIRVVARGAGSATLESSEDVTITGAVNAVTLPITFDDATVNYVVNGFGASDFGAIPVEVISNPDALRINTSEKMLSVNKTVDAQVWAGASIALEGPIDFTKGTTITLQVWSPRAGTPILLKIEDSSSPKDDNGNPTIFVEVQVNSTLVNTWEELTFDLSSNSDFSASNSYDTVIVFPDFGSIGKGELFYFDDIKLPAGEVDSNGQISDDFDANRNISTWFGDACGMDDAFSNPFKEGINTSNTVLEYNDDGGQYANVRFDVVPNFDLTVDNTFTLKIYVPSSSVTGTQPNQISLKLQDGTAGEPWAQQTEIIKPIVLDQWQTVTFDFANDVTAGAADPLNRTDFNRVVLQVNSEGNNDFVTAYIDDFIYGTPDEGTIGGGNGTSGAIALPFDFETTPVTDDFINFDGGVTTVIDNVNTAGNNSFKVAQLIRDGGAVWAGSKIILDSKLDLSVQGGFSMKVFTTAPIGTQVSFKLEDSTNGDINAKVDVVTTVTGAWETLTWDFTGKPSNTYDALVFLFDLENTGNGSSNSTFLFDDIMQVTIGGDTGGGGTACTETTLVLPIDFDCSGIDYASKANRSTATFSVVDNPYKTGANTVDSKVGKFINDNAEGWENILFELDTPVDFATDKTIKLKLYSTVAATIKLKFEAPGATEVDANHGGTGWEELSFTLPSTDSFSDMVLFVDGPGATAGTFYIDDIEQVATTGGSGGGASSIVNGDFETGDKTGWLFFDATTTNGGSVSVTDAESNGGTYSAKITSGQFNNPGIKQERFGAGTILPNTQYQVKLDSKVESLVDGAVVNVLAFSESAVDGDPAILHNLGTVNVAPGAWNSNTLTFTTGGTVSGGVSLLIEVVCGGATTCNGVVYIDNVSFSIVP